VVALFLGWLVANEPLTQRSLAAAGMIVTSVVIVISAGSFGKKAGAVASERVTPAA